jgi:hypothetical protein
MNIRIVAAALAAAVVGTALWQTHAGAAAKKPVALQYDEIVRMAIAPNTPPPPGAFQTDYATIMSGVSTTTATAPPATPTPAPKRHGLFGVLQQVVTGAPSGDDGNSQSDQSGDGNPYVANAMKAMKKMQQGSLTRLTFYKNWLRTDDPVNRTATISKCDIHQFISLDLAHKTYSINNTAPKCPPSNVPAYGGPGRTTVENEAPGTGDITFKNSATNLGPKTLDGIPTIGWDRAMEYASTNSTGSCTNGDFKMMTLAYVSQIVPPRRYCPLPAGSAPSSPESVIVHGGCKPRMHNAMSGFGSISDRLEMYLKMTYGGQAGQAPAVVTERGNVKWYEQPQADALFSVPPGFTKQ